MTEEMKAKLVSEALLARERSYCPYSGFAVGAALLTDTGKIYTGANIESASYTPTVCAERVALFGAIHAGERDFRAIAIVGGRRESEVCAYVTPCGVCRQVIAEFCERDLEILLYDGKKTAVHTLGELFPLGFGKEDLI